MKKRTPHSRTHSKGAKVLTVLFLASFVATLFPVHVGAKGVVRLWPMAEEVRLTRQQDSMALSLLLMPHQIKIPSGQALIIEPWLCAANGQDSVALTTIGIYGRRIYYHVVRGGFNPFQDENEDNIFFIRARELPDTISYAAQTPWESWMQQGVQIHLQYRLVDGCSETLTDLAQTQDFTPAASQAGGMAGGQSSPIASQGSPAGNNPQTADPQADAALEPQPRILKKSGKAYVDFIVNRTDLVPTLHNNPRELQKIRASLDSLVADTTAVITRFTVTGFSSPEGNYENNSRLASGRSETLCQYISDNYGVPRNIISSSFVAEDWAGLRRYVTEKAWPTTPEMLRIMDTEGDPDRRLALIQQRFPREYADIKQNALPYLRHSDYEIEYEQLDPSEPRLSPFRPRSTASTASAANAAARRPTATDAATAGLAAGEDFLPTAPFTPAQPQSFHTYRALFAVKTNLLFDAVLCPNVEVEVPLGRDSRWSVMGEVWFPWWRFDKNAKGKLHKYYRSDQRPTKDAYELLTVGAELRYWLSPRCRAARPVLSGTFIGLYGAGGKYDLGHDGKGDQGEFTSIGLTFGHSWVLSRHWNLELSASAGYVGGPKVHYENEFDDTHLIYRSHNDFRYFGPTKLKLSLAWLIGQKSKKGGDR